MNISKIIDPKISRRAFLALTGIVSALMQSILNLPWLAFFIFAPMVHCLSVCHEKKAFRLDFLCFFVPYYLFQLTFMLTIWKICPLPSFASIPLATLAWLGLTLWECILMYLPLSLFLPLRPHLKHRLSEIVLLCLLLTAGEWLQEKVPISVVCGMAICNKFATAFAIRHAHKLPPYKLYNFPAQRSAWGDIYKQKAFCLHRLCTAFAGGKFKLRTLFHKPRQKA